MPRNKTQEIGISATVDFYDNPWVTEEEAYEAMASILGNFRGPHDAKFYTNRGDMEIELPPEGAEDSYTTIYLSGYMNVPLSMTDKETLEKYAYGIEPYLERDLTQAGLGKGDSVQVTTKLDRYFDKSDWKREVAWEGSFSPEGQEFMNMLKGVVILDGEGTIWLGPEGLGKTVYVAIVHDGGGYTPGGAIYVSDVGSEDGALQAAFEILEEKELNQAMEDGRMAELEEEWNEYEGQAYEILTESFDGRAWTLDAEEAAEIIEKDKYASQYIDIDFD